MSLSVDRLRALLSAEPREAWASLFSAAWALCSPTLAGSGNGKSYKAVTSRDREVGELDTFLATAGWDLWERYYDSVERTSEALISWWAGCSGGRALLILDGLSLREVPWLLEGAAREGYRVAARVTGSELPAETVSFAKALGFGQRSSLENDQAGGAHKFQGARTDSTSVEFHSCVERIDSSPDWVFWHHWPDTVVHVSSATGMGLSKLTENVEQNLTDGLFWKLIERLARGRRVIITSDHGYAAISLFPDVKSEDQVKFLRSRFKAGRSAKVGEGEDCGDFSPPLDLVLETVHGRHAFALGRRKWKIQSGHPLLAHGGLSLLEVAVPFLELWREGQG